MNMYDASSRSCETYLDGRHRGYYFPNEIQTYLIKQLQNQTAPAGTNQPLNIFKDEIFRTAITEIWLPIMLPTLG
jgi:hypothetical protein